MTDPLTYERAVELVRKAKDALRALEAELRVAIDEAADAEGVHRHALSTALRSRRADGLAQDEAMTHARADVAPQLRDHKRAEARVAELHERIANRRGERESLHRLIDWSVLEALGKTRASLG
jgi:hypothetical protein